MQNTHWRPHIVVLANHKGGSGKSTLAMHILVAFLMAGKRVGSIDLDSEQRSLTRYIENRVDWSAKTKSELVIPRHHCVEQSRSAENQISGLVATIGQMEPEHDLIVIDTAGGGGKLNLFAHGLADTLISPINDSFVDLDVIYSGASTDPPRRPSRYAETVRQAFAMRRQVTRRATDWVVVRNRLSTLKSRNQRDVLNALLRIAPEAGFRVASGLMERVVYREYFPVGLTAFDTLDACNYVVKPTTSHLVARMEVRSLLSSLDLLPQEESAGPLATASPPLASAVTDSAAPRQDEFNRALRALLDSLP